MSADFPPQFHRTPDVLRLHENSSLVGVAAETPRDPFVTWMFVAAAGLLFWGGNYLAAYSGRFEALEFNEIPAPRISPGAALPETPEQKFLRLGARSYETVCAACHQADGMGDPSKNIPPLAGSEWVNAAGPQRIIRIVLHGLNGPVKVAGKDWAGNAMPSQVKSADYPTGLVDEEIAATLSYVRNSWGNKASFVSVEDVKAGVAATKGRGTAWTAPELETVSLAGGGGASAALTPEQLKAQLKSLPADQLKTLIQELTPK